jgi:hypothetical protein
MGGGHPPISLPHPMPGLGPGGSLSVRPGKIGKKFPASALLDHQNQHFALRIILVQNARLMNKPLHCN